MVLPAEGGPEFDDNTVVTLAERLDVRLISEPFDNPENYYDMKTVSIALQRGVKRSNKKFTILKKQLLINLRLLSTELNSK